MKGKHGGVQKRFGDLNKRVFCVPCNTCRSNPVFSDTSNSCIGAVMFFNMLQSTDTSLQLFQRDGMWCAKLWLIYGQSPSVKQNGKANLMQPVYYSTKLWQSVTFLFQSQVNPKGTYRNQNPKGSMLNASILKICSCWFLHTVVVHELLYEVNISSKVCIE